MPVQRGRLLVNKMQVSYSVENTYPVSRSSQYSKCRQAEAESGLLPKYSLQTMLS